MKVGGGREKEPRSSRLGGNIVFAESADSWSSWSGIEQAAGMEARAGAIKAEVPSASKIVQKSQVHTRTGQGGHRARVYNGKQSKATGEQVHRIGWESDRCIELGWIDLGKKKKNYRMPS